jgi:hypothetical protein
MFVQFAKMEAATENAFTLVTYLIRTQRSFGSCCTLHFRRKAKEKQFVNIYTYKDRAMSDPTVKKCQIQIITKGSEKTLHAIKFNKNSVTTAAYDFTTVHFGTHQPLTSNLFIIK